VTPEELEECESRIRDINKLSEILQTQNSVVDLSKVLNIRAFDLDKLVNLNPDFLVIEDSVSNSFPKDSYLPA
jgi:G3E family GTPase